MELFRECYASVMTIDTHQVYIIHPVYVNNTFFSTFVFAHYNETLGNVSEIMCRGCERLLGYESDHDNLYYMMNVIDKWDANGDGIYGAHTCCCVSDSDSDSGSDADNKSI